VPIPVSQPSVDEQAALNFPVAEITFNQVVQEMLATQVSINTLYLNREKGVACYQLARAFQHVHKEHAKELIREANQLLNNRSSHEMMKVLQLQAHLDTPEARNNADRSFPSTDIYKKFILQEVAFASVKDYPEEAIGIASSIGDPLNQEVYHRLIKKISQSSNSSEQSLEELAYALENADRFGFNDSVRARIAQAQAKEEFAIGLATAEGIIDRVHKVKALCKIAELATDTAVIFVLLDRAKTIAFAETDPNRKAVMLSTLAKACFKFQCPSYEDVETALTTCLQYPHLSDNTLLQLVKDYAFRDEAKARSIINNKMKDSEKHRGFLTLALVKAKMGGDVEDVLSHIARNQNQVEALCAIAKTSPNEEIKKRLLQQAYESALKRRPTFLSKISCLAIVAETFSELFGDHEISISSS
jgi:hypothetical protein